MNRDGLLRHVASAYQSLRVGLGIIAFAFPIILTGLGRGWYGVPLQGSLSAYYLANPAEQVQTLRSWLAQIDWPPIKYFLFYLGQTEAATPMRSWFVGTLFVVGFFLIVYEGHSRRENRLLNLAGGSALGVAIFPTGYDCGTGCLSFTLHGIFAVLTFAFTAWVALRCSGETLKYLPEPSATRPRFYGFEIPQWLYWDTRTFKRLYFTAFIGMVGLPALIFIFHGWLGFSNIYILLAEWAALWSFAAYWLLKSWELSQSLAEFRLMHGTLDEGQPTSRNE